MKCLVFSNTVHSGSNTYNSIQSHQPHQPKIDIGVIENITIRPTPLV
jgi:hypothetical protein